MKRRLMIGLAALGFTAAAAAPPEQISPAGRKAIQGYFKNTPMPAVSPAKLRSLHEQIVTMANSSSPNLAALQRLRADEGETRLALIKEHSDRFNAVLSGLSPADQLVLLRRKYPATTASVTPLVVDGHNGF